MNSLRSSTRCRSFIPLVVVLLATACVPKPASLSGAPEVTLAIVGVNVVPMDREEMLRDRTVLIAGDRIVSVTEANTSIPPTARQIDARGQYLIPGLWDMHVHALDNVDTVFPQFVAHGVTGVRDMGSFTDSLRAVRARLRDGELLGPRLVSPGPLLDGPRHRWSNEVAWHLEEVKDVAPTVDSLLALPVDFLKVYSTLSRDVYLALAGLARERGVAFVGHVPFSITALEASNAGQASLEHAGLDITTLDCVSDGAARMRNLLGVWGGEGYGAYLAGMDQLRSERDPRCVEALYASYRANGTFVTPTVVNTIKDSSSVDWQVMSLMSEEARQACEGTIESFHQASDDVRRQYFRGFLEDIGALYRAGVPLLAGTDMPNPCLVAGTSLHDELEWLVEAGLTPYEALRSATVHPAMLLGASDTLGTVRPRHVADLVLLENNPLQDIRATRTITGVVLAGRFLDVRALEQLVSDVGNQ